MNRGPAWSFPGKKKSSMPSDAPGPGNYMSVDPSRYKDAAPKYSIKGSGGHSFHKGNDLPGPGAYSGKLDPVREKGPAFSMGGKYKNKYGSNDAPGPGAYSAKGGFNTIGGVMGAKHVG